MRKIFFLCALCASTLMAFAQDTRMVVTECYFTGWNPALITNGLTNGKTGNQVKSDLLNSLTPAEGAVYYIAPTMSNIGKWDDEKYDFPKVTTEQITPGYYYLWTQLRIDGENGSLYRLPDNYEDLTVYVDGQKWNVYTTTSVEPTYSYVWISSPVYPIGDVPVLKQNGDLPGKFSVSADKQVRFASGNLQRCWYYDYWQFAGHQWDVIGADNANISDPNFQGCIDLFGWGTSGYNGKSPQMTSATNTDYGPATGDIAGTPYDWGSVAESMDLDTTWRTLTADEWNYLLNTRDNASNLRSIAVVNGDTGLIILPDDWSFSQTILKLEPMEGEDDIIINARKWEQWWEMAGAVFLPCAGLRVGTSLYRLNTYGFYWSSSAVNETKASAVRFFNGECAMNDLSRSSGASVRLAKDVLPKPDTLSGKFSVADGKQIQFSKGNLQYHCKNQAWHFAAEQTDYIGVDNSDKTDAYDGWIDLFGWGTGNNPNWRTQNNSDYPTFVDWGIKIGEPDEWRTLTADEWKYLFLSRTNATTLFGLGTVNYVKGLFIFPDNWELPAGASFTASTTQGLDIVGVNFSNANNDNFEHNTYTLKQWSVMESAGAVFLPVAGRRLGQTATVSEYGYYWSSTEDDEGAFYLLFDSECLRPKAHNQRYVGQSVRLVHDVPEAPEAIGNVTTGEKAVKRIVNGQLIIERDGKVFNAQGIEVK